jgi:hypothetical protein
VDDRDAPKPRNATIRQALLAVLRAEELTARELSAKVSVTEREVVTHLEHLGHSLEHGSERLSVVPPCCAKCSYRFDARTRFSRPSRCPQCKSERVLAARFTIRPR